MRSSPLPVTPIPPSNPPTSSAPGTFRPVGQAPVAGGKVNVGIILGRSWSADLSRRGALAVADSIVSTIPPTDEDSIVGEGAHSACWRLPS